MANDSIRGRQVVLRLTNKSGGGLVEGDVVIISSGTAAAVTTTTTAGLNTDAIGVALETIAADAIGRICIAGYVPKINLSGAASLGDTFATHTVAKQAAPSASRGAGAFGEVLGTGSTPVALLWGLPDASGASGMATDALWDAAGDLAVGTGANTGGRLAKGTALQVLQMKSDASTPEWAARDTALANYGATSTVVGWSSTTAKTIEYWEIGSTVFVQFFINGTSDSTAVTFTLPYTSSASEPDTFGAIAAADNGVQLAAAGSYKLPSNSNTVTCYKDFANGGWTNANAKYVIGQFFFKKA